MMDILKKSFIILGILLYWMAILTSGILFFCYIPNYLAEAGLIKIAIILIEILVPGFLLFLLIIITLIGLETLIWS